MHHPERVERLVVLNAPHPIRFSRPAQSPAALRSGLLMDARMATAMGTLTCSAIPAKLAGAEFGASLQKGKESRSWRLDRAGRTAFANCGSVEEV
jgi:hypothetical protein